jgi:hypothetical protein
MLVRYALVVLLLPLYCGQVYVVVVLLHYWSSMCCCCVASHVCYVITITGRKHFKDLLLFSYSS